MTRRDRLSVALLTFAVSCGGQVDRQDVGAPTASVGRSTLGATTQFRSAIPPWIRTVRAVATNANYVNGFDVGSGHLALHAD